MTWKIHLNLPKTNSPKVVVRATQSWSWNIFLSLVFYVTTKRKKKTMLSEVIWSLGGHLELNAILYQSLSKIRSNSKLPSTIVTNISRSPPHTTSWFTEVRHPHLKTNRQGLLSHVHILMVSKSNLKLQVFGLFSRFVRTLTIKISSSEEPASSTSIHRVRNGDKLVILFHPFPKNITKSCRSPRRALKISKWRRMRGTSFIGACAKEMHQLRHRLSNKNDVFLRHIYSMLHLFLNTYTTTF